MWRVGLRRLLAISPSCKFDRKTASSGPVFDRCRLGRLNHIGIAVPDLEKAKSLYEDVLGAEAGEKCDLPEHGVTTIEVQLPNVFIELIHPLGDNSPATGFLQRRQVGGIHHLCIQVNDVRAAAKALKSIGVELLNEEPKMGAHGKPVVFCNPKDCSGVLLELEQI